MRLDSPGDKPEPSPIRSGMVECPVCGKMLSPNAPSCTACGEPMKSAAPQPMPIIAQPRPAPVAPPKSLAAAILLNLFLPGAGYMYMGRVGLGIAALIFVVCTYAWTPLIVVAGAWISLNLVMLIDMLILHNKHPAGVEAPEPGKSRGWFIGFGVALIFLLTCAYIADRNTSPSTVNAISNLEALQSIAKSAKATQSEAPPSFASPQTAVATYEMGHPFRVGYTSYQVHSIQWSDAALAGQAPNAAYLAVEVSVKNEDREARIVPPFKLIDEAGAEYDESSNKIFMQESINLLENLNPGVTKRGWLLFDTPQNHTYKLKASGGFWSKDAALVPLK